MTLNRSIEILVNLILVPALMIFTVLLYAYVGKIILAGALPKGMVSNIALPYLVGGLGVYALRSISVKPNWDGFFKFFPYLSIVPIALLWLAIDLFCRSKSTISSNYFDVYDQTRNGFGLA